MVEALDQMSIPLRSVNINSMAIETPKYKVIKKEGKIEIRKYEGYINAEVEVEASGYNSAGNYAFSALADYIFGNNISSKKIAMTVPVSSTKVKSSEKIAMTAPVNTSMVNSSRYKVTFTMPSKYSIDTLPKPVNNQVKIKQIKPHESLVIKFSGYTTEGKVEKLVNTLRTWANLHNIKINENPIISRFDPPWMPGIFRHNEIVFEIID